MDIYNVNGKEIDIDKVKFHLISKKPEKGDFLIIFDDDSELYLSVAENAEMIKLIRERHRK